MKKLFKWILTLIRMMSKKTKEHTIDVFEQAVASIEQTESNRKYLRGLKNARCRYAKTKGFTIKPTQDVN